jgi:predicted O-linked N-acetylglucosamine transferase (SPINDLY family)
MASSLPPAQQALLEQGFALHAEGRFQEARDVYSRISPPSVDSLRLLGTAEYQLGRFPAALDLLQKSLDIVPDQYEVHLVMGDVLQAMGRVEDALACYDLALHYEPRYAQAHTNRGDCLLRLGRMEAAADSFTTALRIDPELKWVPGAALFARTSIADWRDFETERQRLLDNIAQTGTASGPATLQSLADAPDMQRRAAESFMTRKVPARGLLPALEPHPPHNRLRVGYFSADFYNHPLVHLLAGLFEQHDRNRFEIFAFSTLDRPADAWRQRVRAAADHWIDLTGLPAQEAARRARALEIDIAVDLTGLTEGFRPDIFAERAAPVQASYLGYLGSMGAAYYDYLIADEVIAPPDKRGFYTEKIACLPSYQINDDQQEPSGRTFSRAELGLPNDGFVFASFNQVYKILPEVFDGWMRILGRTHGSVLWLYCNNATARGNLTAEAERRGVDPARLVFAGRLAPDDHLARLKHADLFLDTFPYNAGATASGALRVGLPVLTRIGQSFPARMGASLLTGVGLTELITETAEAYENLAVALATDPARMAAIKAKLRANLPGSILFDTSCMTRHLETLFEAMHARAQNGSPPEDITIKS